MVLGERAASWARGVGAGLVLLVPVLVVTLLLQHLDVYLTFFGETAAPTAGDARRYVVTASLCLACPVLAAVAALLGRSRPLFWWAATGLVVALVAGALFAVPSDRFEREDPVYPVNPDYTPCYSGSNDCAGG